MEEVVGVDLSVGVPKRYEEPESCGSAADFLLGVEMERDPPGREEVEVDVLMAVETDLLSNHNDSTKCQSSYPATSAINDDDQVDLAVDDVKKMPKRRKTFGRSQKRGGDRKLGDGGEGIACMPPVAPTQFAVALQPDTRGTSITLSNQMKYIPKKTLFRQLQQMEVNILILFHPQLVAQFVKLTASPFYPTDSMPTCTGTG